MTTEEEAKVKEITKEVIAEERKQPESRALVPVQALPELTVHEARQRYDKMVEFVKSVMKEDIDFGTIPGTNKPTLYKPGAEKLSTFFGLEFRGHEDLEIIDDWDKGFFYRRRNFRLWKGDRLVAEATASINSRESRYRWRWVKEEDLPPDTDKSKLKTRSTVSGEWGWAYDQRSTSGRYGKPESYWKKFDDADAAGTLKRVDKVQHWNNQKAVWLEVEDVEYRIENDDIYTVVNTLDKMVDKRGLIAVVLIACNASEFFTQDVEDMNLDPEADDKVASPAVSEVVEGTFTEAKPEQKPSESLESTLEDLKASAESGDMLAPQAVLDASNKMGFDASYFSEVREKHTDGKNRNWSAMFLELYKKYQNSK